MSLIPIGLITCLRDLLQRLRHRLSDRQMMLLLAVVVGVLAGAGTCIFEVLLHLVRSALVSPALFFSIKRL